MNIEKEYLLKESVVLNQNKNQFFQTVEEIENWLKKYNIYKYTINDDLTVDVDGDVNISSVKNIKLIPIKFGRVGGNFYCCENELTSLQGAPQEVGGDFVCSWNQLTSLQGAPQEVGGNFYCSWNQLTSLQGAPQEIGGNFSCSENELTSLQGAPQEVGGDFYCSDNKLTSLQGAPQEVGGNFYCSENKLTSLQGAPQEVGGCFYCSNNQLTSLQGAPQEVGGIFYCYGNQLTSLQGAPQEVGGDFYVDDYLKSELQQHLKVINKPKSHENIIKKKYNINSPSLYNIALILSKKYEDGEKIDIRDLKKEINSNNYLGQLFTKKDGQAFIRKFSNGFNINDIIKYDEENTPKDGFLKTLKIGTDLEIDFTVWNGAQKIFKEKNYVFQLNFSKDITKKLISDSSNDKYNISGEHEGVFYEIETSNKNNLKAYIKNSNHPTSKELLTMGWIRFTLFPEKHALVIDEIQTDLDDKEFLGQEIMKGWEDILMNTFIKYARNDLNYQKIYMPTYKTKLDMYSANPPMRLYKELPNRFGFKTKSDWDGFMLLEKKIMSFIEKEFSKIKENIDNKFSGVILLEVWEYTKFHNSIPNVFGAITRYVTKKGFQINRKEFLEEFGFEGTEHAEKNTKQKFIDGSIKELEGIFSMFGQGTKLIGWLARKLFSKTTKQNKVIDLYVDGIKQREKCFIEIINRGYRFELKMEIK